MQSLPVAHRKSCQAKTIFPPAGDRVVYLTLFNGRDHSSRDGFKQVRRTVARQTVDLKR